MKRRDREGFSLIRNWGRVFATPLLVNPQAFVAMLPGIEAALRGESTPAPDALVANPGERSKSSGLMVEGGVAIIPVYGPLIHRGRFDAAECEYITGYQDVVKALAAARDDPSVMAAAMIFDTPGGEVAGLFEAAQAILDARAWGKPIEACVSSSACSAGYALASSCQSVSVSPTSIVGSIGVYTRHVSMEAWLKNEGLKVTELFVGSHKADGSPYKDLPADVADRIQARLETLYQMFVELVARNMGLSQEAIRATNADVFMGAEAVALGLAHRIETPDQMIARLATASTNPVSFQLPGLTAPVTSTQEAQAMNEIPETVLAALGLPADASADQAVAKITSMMADAKAEGIAEENARMSGILALPEAAGREAAALALASVHGLSPEAAKGVLAAMSEQVKIEAITPANDFAKLMTSLGNPDVGANADTEATPEARELAEARSGWRAAYQAPQTR